MKCYESAFSHVLAMFQPCFNHGPLSTSPILHQPSDRPNGCQKVLGLVAGKNWSPKSTVRGLAPTELVVFRKEAILFPGIPVMAEDHESNLIPSEKAPIAMLDYWRVQTVVICCCWVGLIGQYSGCFASASLIGRLAILTPRTAF